MVFERASGATTMTGLRLSWPFPPSTPALSGTDIHVWAVPLDRPQRDVRSLARVLCAEELERARRLRFARVRDRFIVERGALRHLLGQYAVIEPGRLQFRYGLHGKPALTGDGGAVCFNVSHSQGVALVAVTRGRELGVDVERIRPMFAVDRIAERFFAAREAAMLRALPPSEKQVAFFLCWTRKEAYIKAVGDGLARPLDRFEVSVGSGQPAELLSVDGDPDEASRWSLHDLRPASGYVAALAVKGGCGKLGCWQWPAQTGTA